MNNSQIQTGTFDTADIAVVTGKIETSLKGTNRELSIASLIAMTLILMHGYDDMESLQDDMLLTSDFICTLGPPDDEDGEDQVMN